MDDLSQTTNGAPPSIAQSVVSVMTGQNTLTRKNRRVSTGMSNPKKIYEEVLSNSAYLFALNNILINKHYVQCLATIHPLHRTSSMCTGTISNHREPISLLRTFFNQVYLLLSFNRDFL